MTGVARPTAALAIRTASPGAAARRALRRDARRARPDWCRHRRAARRLALARSSRPMTFVFVTMRPSDVPTYVEAGAADVGITGKDVLMEQSDRVFYELLDLGYGGCRMVLAGPDGDDRLAEQERRLGALRDRHQVSAHRGALLRGHRPRRRGDRGQGIGRAGARLGTRRRDRRPRRHRTHASRQRLSRPRGDRRPRPRA